MFTNCNNSKKQGDVGLGQAIAYFTQQGYTVSLPLTDNQAYDLIFDNGEINRVQVKTTRNKIEDKWYNVNLRTMGGNQSYSTVKKFDNTKVEYLFVVTENGFNYLIPTKELKAKASITLYNPYNKYIINGQVGELVETSRL